MLLSLTAEKMHFPRPSDGKKLTRFEWTPLRYRNVISLPKNPFYAGAYAYGKSGKRSTVVDGRVRKSYGHRKPFEQWEVMINDHHPGYIEWAEYERNQKLLAANNYAKPGDVKSGRGGRALLPGVLLCGHCGRRLCVVYTGRVSRPLYRCERPNQQLGLPHTWRPKGVPHAGPKVVTSYYQSAHHRKRRAARPSRNRFSVAPAAIERVKRHEGYYNDKGDWQDHIVGQEEITPAGRHSN